MLSNARQPRVLVAVNPSAAVRLCRILAGMEVEQAQSLQDLVRILGCNAFDLIVVGSHFDGSRTIEALRCARRLASRTSLACIRGTPFSSSLGDATVGALRAAAYELGVDVFIDVVEIPDDEEGNAGVRAILERVMHATSG